MLTIEQPGLGQNACGAPYLGGNFGNQIENKRTPSIQASITIIIRLDLPVGIDLNGPSPSM